MKNEIQAMAKDVSPDQIQGRIIAIRSVQVMLDRDLAELYGVPVKRLNEQVSHNIERVPDGFMFQLSAIEFATTSCVKGTPRCSAIVLAPEPVIQYLKDSSPITPSASFKRETILSRCLAKCLTYL